MLRLTRPPVQALLERLLTEEPEAIEALGEATGHDAVAFVRELRGEDPGDL